MFFLRLIGFGLMLIAVAAGAAILLQPFYAPQIVSTMSMWALFVLAFPAGLLLLTIGAEQRRMAGTLTLAGSVLLLFALVAAGTLLATNLSLGRTADSTSSWLIFLLCVPVGLALLLMGRFFTLQPSQRMASPRGPHGTAPSEEPLAGAR
ncbi:MAG: hypothetical protein JWN02_616 [Acidobacteria bacterium]|nr:hypothetical protein [Acidobacteriota bacterium]